MASRFLQLFNNPEQMFEQRETHKTLNPLIPNNKILDIFDHIVHEPAELQFLQQQFIIFFIQTFLHTMAIRFLADFGTGFVGGCGGGCDGGVCWGLFWAQG